MKEERARGLRWRINLILTGSLLLIGVSGLSQWSDQSVEKVCSDPGLAVWFQQSYHTIAKNLDSAVFYSEKGIRLARQKQNIPALCLGYILLSRIHLITPDYAKSLEYFDLASGFAENLHNPELEAYIQYVKAVKNMMLDRQKESIDATAKAVRIYERIHDTTGLISLNKLMGSLYLNSDEPKDLGRAREYFNRTLALQIGQKDLSRLSSAFSNISIVHMKEGQFDSARIYILKAIRLDEQFGNTIWLATDYMRMGEVKLADNQYDSAEYYMLQAARYFSHPNDKALNLISLGKVKLRKKEYDKAQELFMQAYHLTKANNNQQALSLTLRELTGAAEARNDPAAALAFYKEYVSLKDTMDKSGKVTTLSLLEIQRQHDLKTTRMEVEQEKLALVSQRKSGYIIFLVILSILLIMISVVIIYYLRLRQRATSLEKSELDKTLEFRNRELALQVMNLMQRNEFIIETSRKLIGIPDNMQPHEMKTEVIKIAKSLQDQTDKEIWEEFELRFKQVHSGFYERLLAQFPDLTPNELKICGLLRLNLTTKEMSELTGQRKEAIEMARFRLRKHLGLNDPQINLVNFLARI